MSVSVVLNPDLIGKTIIVQSFERGALDPDDLGDMSKWVGVLASYGIGHAATLIYLRYMPQPIRIDKGMYAEFYVPASPDARGGNDD